MKKVGLRLAKATGVLDDHYLQSPSSQHMTTIEVEPTKTKF